MILEPLQLLVPVQPAGIQIHLVNGHKHMFYQQDISLVQDICADLETHIFARASLIIEGYEDVIAFPGHAIVCVSVLTDPLPVAFYEREKLQRSVVIQLSADDYRDRRRRPIENVEGTYGVTLSEIEFVNGERVFLEMRDVVESAIDERLSLNHLFKRPTLTSRRMDCGFSVWNSSHIVSWSLYPKLQVPENAWVAELLPEPAMASLNNHSS